MISTFSHATAKRINWTAIKDSSIGTSVRGGDATGITRMADSPVAAREVQASDLERVFATMRSEFKSALSGLRRLMNIILLLAGLSLAAAIAGTIIAGTLRAIFGGMALSTVGVVALIDLLRRVARLGREQAMLELIPAKYELALSIAETSEDRRKVLNSLMKEMDSLH
jgi:hypothetical protein